MVSLPVHITLNILSRLHVKSLVRSRCVCKSWTSLISSPSFIKMHLHHWSNFPGFDIYNYADDCVPQLAMYDPEKSQHHDLDLPIDRHRGMNIEVIGSCNGVLCFSTYYEEDNCADSKIFLWNPFINELEPLPDSSYPVGRSIGFGWNDSAGGDLGEFKVVNIHATGKCLDKSSQVEAWLVLFDVSKEEFHEEELPDMMPGEDKYIAVLDGCLSVIAQSRQPELKGYVVWVMKEFGSFHSWTKLYTIATSYDPCHRPLGFTSSRKLLFMRNFYIGLRFGSLTYLVLYDRTRDEFDSFSRRNRKGSLYKSRMVNHVASLVSPRAHR